MTDDRTTRKLGWALLTLGMALWGCSNDRGRGASAVLLGGGPASAVSLGGEPSSSGGAGEQAQATGGAGGATGGSRAAFESDDPTQASSQVNGTGTGGSGTTLDSTGGSSSGTANNTSDEATRAIVEADIIQVQGDTLYALSNYTGLSVIDVSSPAALRFRGRYRVPADPFEMYVRDGIAYAMYASFPRYEYDATTGYTKTVVSSRLVAIDARNPGAMQVVGTFDLPGTISDSRMVGDIIYVVSYENGSCWGCAQNQPRTTVTSINARDPAAISQVDQLAFDDQKGTNGWYRRSISVTTNRLYVSGMIFDGSWGTDTGHSTIQVVDISDPDGDLVAGTQVEVTGQIESRWQMDEYDGVLRVLSQAGSKWTNGPAPTVETFTVASATAIVPLGKLTLTLPQRENLMSVRFDGTRAYAVTFQQTDPLFTIDLADPALPVQVGALEMPGYIYYMEPRGERLIALGLDRGNADGGMFVSIFDVADLAHPTELARANFGQKWGWAPEDQDRIHKAFRIFDQVGLIAMPFAGWSYSGNACGAYTSGVQLFDFTQDTVTARGVVPLRGQAKRAFLHGERLFAVSDDQVASFDLTDRDAPVRLDALALASIADKTVRAGDYLVSLGLDWWTNAPQVTVAALDAGESAIPLASYDLTSTLEPTGSRCLWGYWSSFYQSAELFAEGDAVYLVYDAGFADSASSAGGADAGTTSSKGSVGFAVLDLSDPIAPKLAGARVLPLGQPVPPNYPGSYYYYYYGLGVGAYTSGLGIWPSGRRIVQAGSTVVLEERVPLDPTSGTDYWRQSDTRAILHAVDLSNPSDIRLASSTTLSDGISAGGLWSDGSVVMTSTYQRVEDNPGRVRFYVDRLDYASPASPGHNRVNVPGSLLGVDAGGQRVVTVDYTRRVEAAPDAGYASCAVTQAFDTAYYQHSDVTTEAGVVRSSYPTGCVYVHRALKLVDLLPDGAALVDTFEPTGDRIVDVQLGMDRLFLLTYASGRVSRPYGITILTGVRAGQLEVASSRPIAGYSQRIHDTKFATLPGYPDYQLVIYDAADPVSPVEVLRSELGVPTSYLRDLTLDDDYVILSAGSFGAWAVPLASR